MRKFMVSNGMTFSGTTILARAAGLALALAAAGVWLPGCERDDPVATTIRSTTIELAAMSAGASASVSPASDSQAYKKIIGELKGVSGRGGDGQQAAVDLLTARANVGLAGQAAAGVADTEESALRSIAGVRGALQEYLAYSAQAAALSQYDPAPLLAELDKQTTARDADLSKARKAKQEIDARVAALKAQAQAKADQAAAEHKIEAELREQAIRVSNTEAAELLVQANQHRRIADAFDVEASTLDAEAAQIAPQSPEAQLVIDQMVRQKDQLGRARQEIIQRDADNRQLATEARASQANAAGAVEDAVKAVSAARADLPGKYEEAQRLYQDALGSATKAMKANRSQANLSAGEANQALGGLHWRRAQGLDSLASLLEGLAVAKPALPNQADYAGQAAEARTAQKASLDAATEAYDLAKTAYAGSGAASRLEELDKGLAEIILKTSGGTRDRRSTEEPAAPDAGAELPTDSPTADADGPKATVDAVFGLARADEFERLGDYVHISKPALRQVFDATLPLLPKMKRLHVACKAKFGKSPFDVGASPGAMPQSGIGMNLLDADSVDVSGIVVSVEGDRATATPAAGGTPLRLVRVNDKWLLDGDSDGPGDEMDESMIPMVLAMLPMLEPITEELAANVESGAYATYEEFDAAQQKKFTEALMGPGGGPGGGGGGG